VNGGDGRVPLSKRSVAWRWALLALGTLWAIGVAVFLFGFHLNEPHGVLTITTGGRTFAGNPPALTLYERDGVIWEIALFLIALVLLSGAADLLFRCVRLSAAPGILAIVAGAILVAYSLFGLIYGLLGIGTIGVLVILVGLPMKPQSSVGLALDASSVPR
jgi:hypothetical protein